MPLNYISRSIDFARCRCDIETEFLSLYAFNLFNALLQLKRLCPDSEAEFYIQAGIDKEGFEVKYIFDYKGISATRENKHVWVVVGI